MEPTGWFMSGAAQWHDRPLAAGYTLGVEHDGARTIARIGAADGEVAASGYAAETSAAFVYDRIVTAPAHRRRGLGRAIMSALRAACRTPGLPHLLVATDEGRALYATLGWRCHSPSSTVSIAPADAR